MSIHVSPVRAYVGVFVGLLVLTVTTVLVALVDMGPFNDIVALSIAVSKMLLVVLFFMHAKFSTRLTKAIVLGALVWLIILITLTLSDYMTRGWGAGV